MDREKRRFIFANNLFAPRMIQTVLQQITTGWDISQVNAYDPFKLYTLSRSLKKTHSGKLIFRLTDGDDVAP